MRFDNILIEKGVLDMASVFDYLKWRGDLNVKNDPINDIDALILSRLSYFPFDGIVDDNLDNSTTILSASKQFFRSDKNRDLILWKGDSELLEEAGKAPRFCNMKLSGYVNIIENEKQMQFSAVVIKISKDCHYISFRGTDNSVIGWQEDFNMYYMFPLPSQLMAVDYLNNVAEKYNGNLILGGHSKGGNLAVYASAYCDKSIQKRITAIYNHDGPGFDRNAINESGFEAIKDKIHTYVPQSSIFGMMFEHQEDYTIIKSNQKGFFQHDIYSWEVDRTKLVTLNHMTNTSIFFDHTLTEFVENMSDEDKRNFIESVFSLLKSTENKTFNEIIEHWVKNSGTILKSISNLDSETRKLILSTMLKFIKCAKNNFSDINPLKKKNRMNSKN